MTELTLKEKFGSGGFKRKFIRLLEQPSIVTELANNIRPSYSLYHLEARKLLGCSPRMIIDVGANIGEFARAGNFNFPAAEIICFEPQEEHIRNLEAMKNVFAYSCGLWDKNVKKMFYRNLMFGNDDQSSFLKPREYTGVKVKLRLRRFDDLDIVIKKPCFLKVDVEGAEEEVLRGFGKQLKDVDVAMIEVHYQPKFKNQSKAGNIIKLMEANGFKGFKQLNFTYLNNKPEKSDLMFFK